MISIDDYIAELEKEPEMKKYLMDARIKMRGIKAKLRMPRYIKQVRKRIKEDEYDGFTSNQIIENNGYVDFLFLGKYDGKPVVWNACITSAKGDYFDKVHELAMGEAYAKFPLPEGYNFLDSLVDVGDGSGNMEYINPTPELSKKRYTWGAKRALELFDSGNIHLIPWNVEIDTTYEYGIGLHVRMDTDEFNVDDVKFFIESFNKYGPTVFHDLNYDHTPISLTADELGVELKDGDMFITWVRDFTHNDVAIKDGVFG
jgi:hypothetical protein